ncbi:hypothetical protein [Gymnodinialimonas sp.]
MNRTPTYQPTVKDLGPRDDWSALEKDLWKECRLGRIAVLAGKEDLPEDCEDPDRRVRATFIRYLMWGGSEEEGGTRPHPKGVWIRGAWIEGKLDLEACVASIDLTLEKCRLPEAVTLHDAQVGGLYLPGCHGAKGLDLHRLTTIRDVHLRGGFQSDGPVDLGGAQIGGQLGCDGGAFKATEGRALNCDAAEVGASVFLSDGFEALGEVNLMRARIGGQLACEDGAFKATKGLALSCQAAEIGADVLLRGTFSATQLVDFTRAVVVGNLMVVPQRGEAPTLEEGIALAGARIGGGFFWKSVTGARRAVDLTEAKVGSLRDDWAAWDRVGELKLDGFHYDRVEGSMSVTDRLAWLGRACEAMDRPVEVGPGFDPQPHVQLASVLRAQGNREGAARVLVDREKRQRAAERARVWARNTSPQGLLAWLTCAWLRVWDLVFGLVFGYGHKPVRALLASLFLIVIAAGLNCAAYHNGQFAPNSDVVLTSDDWLGAVAEAGDAGFPLVAWLQSPAAQDYETFNAMLYGLDLFLPLDALGQEEAWRATTGRGALGEVAFYSRWFFQIAGIVIAAMGAAVLTGVVGRRD